MVAGATVKKLNIRSGAAGSDFEPVKHDVCYCKQLVKILRGRKKS